MTEQAKRTRMSAEDRRASILDVAAALFAEVGYRAGKASEVARRVGVSEPVVFQNFGTKATLFAAVIDRAADQVCAVLVAMTAASTPVPDLLRGLLDPGHLVDIHGAGSIGAIFADAAAVTGEPAIEVAARDSTRRFAAALTALLHRGQADGDLRPDLDAEAAAWWLLSLLAAQRFRRSTASDPDTIEAKVSNATLEFLIAP
ncbi:AcrR family transcriptional regulator [Actinokineospora baliensis]|uniref:TetR/AcrR family transcriptional regulator n=1 Tax=Actinokineospora baliensis TaxID=547056 RepID=UPI0027DBEC36|nr:TetR/AcrR family transcriptional regulator [Actinokineospora baliensis]MBM7774752.1 AcrR family transcriptional regulator [Actinokineospora baliensis]